MARNTEEIEKQGFHHGSLKETASAKAYTLVCEGGVSALNLRKIATECGVDHSALYRHFKNKNELIASVLLQGFINLNVSLAKHKSGGAQKYLENYVGFAFQFKEIYSLMFSSIGRKFYKTPEVESEIQKLIRSSACTIGNISEDEKISSDLRDKVIRVWSMVHGQLHLWHNGILKAKSDKLARLYIYQQTSIYISMEAKV